MHSSMKSVEQRLPAALIENEHMIKCDASKTIPHFHNLWRQIQFSFQSSSRSYWSMKPALYALPLCLNCLNSQHGWDVGRSMRSGFDILLSSVPHPVTQCFLALSKHSLEDHTHFICNLPDILKVWDSLSMQNSLCCQATTEESHRQQHLPLWTNMTSTSQLTGLSVNSRTGQSCQPMVRVDKSPGVKSHFGFWMILDSQNDLAVPCSLKPFQTISWRIGRLSPDHLTGRHPPHAPWPPDVTTETEGMATSYATLHSQSPCFECNLWLSLHLLHVHGSNGAQARREVSFTLAKRQMQTMSLNVTSLTHPDATLCGYGSMDSCSVYNARWYGFGFSSTLLLDNSAADFQRPASNFCKPQSEVKVHFKHRTTSKNTKNSREKLWKIMNKKSNGFQPVN